MVVWQVRGVLKRAALALALAASGTTLPLACADFKTAVLGGADGSFVSNPYPDSSSTSPWNDASDDIGDAGADAKGPRVCTQTICPLAEMSGELHNPEGLAVDATHLYWVETGAPGDDFGELARIPKAQPCLHAGGGCREVLDAQIGGSSANATGLKLGPNDICYTETRTPSKHALYCMPLAGGTRKLVYSGAGDARCMTIAEDSIYWAVLGTKASAADGAIFAASLRGGGDASVQTVAANRMGPHGVAIYKNYVFWTEFGKAGGEGTIYRSRPDGGSFAWFLSKQPDPRSLVLHGAFMYWANVGDGTIRRTKPTDDWSLDRLANGEVGPLAPTALAVDDSGVYWISAGTSPDYLDGVLSHTPLTGGPITRMMTSLAGPAALALDEGFVYVVTRGTRAKSYIDGKIIRVAKTY